jgi:hypothetical protein
METERYELILWGIDPRYYNRVSIGDIWNTAAKKVYEETGIIVVGEVYDSYFVDPSNETPSEQYVFTVKSIRIMHENDSEMEYWEAYVKVVEEVKTALGNPRTGLITEKARLNIFEDI